jgi:hypothetical protein
VSGSVHEGWVREVVEMAMRFRWLSGGITIRWDIPNGGKGLPPSSICVLASLCRGRGQLHVIAGAHARF